MGDMNGIGPEVAIKAAYLLNRHKSLKPVLVGAIDVFALYARKLGVKMTLREVNEVSARSSSGVVEVIGGDHYGVPKPRPGRLSEDSGHLSGVAIVQALTMCVNGTVDAMVTAPVSKEAMNAGGFRFPGHTEMLARLTRTPSVLMMLVAGDFRVALATVHVPLASVSGMLTRSLLLRKLALLHTSLRNDFDIRRPRIAVLGLNPHAGESGLIGSEESRVIEPALEKARSNGLRVRGPFPADGFFGLKLHTAFDAVLAMYHDQGLIPLKMEGFATGVNVTAGLPIVRTSPDHGTAFDIAGKNAADPTSMMEAILLAHRIAGTRKRKGL